jgi:molybdopterin-binding protein
MKVSARNAFKGQISALQPGAVNAEVTITTTAGDTLVAIVTTGSVQSLGLAVGKEVVALVKAPWVMLATSDCGLKFSARNQLEGSVSKLVKGAVNTVFGGHQRSRGRAETGRGPARQRHHQGQPCDPGSARLTEPQRGMRSLKP